MKIESDGIVCLYAEIDAADPRASEFLAGVSLMMEAVSDASPARKIPRKAEHGPGGTPGTGYAEKCEAEAESRGSPAVRIPAQCGLRDCRTDGARTSGESEGAADARLHL